MPTADELARFPLLAPLTAQQRAEVAAISQTVSFAAGERLFDDGQPAEHCWLINSGRVAIETHLPGAGQSVIQTLGAGDVLGLSWLVPPYRWQFAAVAVETVTALELDAGSLRVLAEWDPELGYRLLLGLFEELAARLHATRARLLDLYVSPRERASIAGLPAPISGTTS
jgi:CRP-like cAMP-binding protein